MVSRVELITLHALDLLELLGANIGDEGTLTLMTQGEDQIELDLNDLCLVVKIESTVDLTVKAGSILPFGSQN